MSRFWRNCGAAADALFTDGGGRCGQEGFAIERKEEEKKAIADDIKEIYAEAKGNGFDTKVLRQIIRIRKQDASERMEQEALLELYMAALGMAVAPKESDYEE